MHATRTLPEHMLGADGRATCRTIHAISIEASKRGMRYVPASSRPARIAQCDGLWTAPGNGASLILLGCILILSERT